MEGSTCNPKNLDPKEAVMNAQEKLSTVRILGNRLETITNSGETISDEEVLNLLKELDSLPFPMNRNLLWSTRIGRTVNQLRKNTKNKEVSSLGRALIKKWKDLVVSDTEEKGKGKETGSKTSSTSIEKPKKRKYVKRKGKKSSTSSGGYKKLIKSVDDEMRCKGCKLLLEAIQGNGHLPDGANDPEYLSKQLEQHIFQEFKNTETKYRTRILNCVANLKDAKNSNLRLNFLLGKLSTERLAKMTSEDMASDELKALRAKSVPKMINQYRLLASNERMDLHFYKCPECGSTNTYSYKLYKKPTRSGDEPMTTFVCCNGCRYQWKLN